MSGKFQGNLYPAFVWSGLGGFYLIRTWIGRFRCVLLSLEEKGYYGLD
ncbi:hypothetical protein [Pseudomonas phage PfAC04]|nr:hypothetical protein [Pseudomonas phage PfAC04]